VGARDRAAGRAAAAHRFVRSLSPRRTDDRPLGGEIDAVAAAIRDGSLVAAIEDEVGPLR
jgi:histidine ammonia-lyase